MGEHIQRKSEKKLIVMKAYHKDLDPLGNQEQGGKTR